MSNDERLISKLPSAFFEDVFDACVYPMVQIFLSDKGFHPDKIGDLDPYQVIEMSDATYQAMKEEIKNAFRKTARNIAHMCVRPSYDLDTERDDDVNKMVDIFITAMLGEDKNYKQYIQEAFDVYFETHGLPNSEITFEVQN